MELAQILLMTGSLVAGISVLVQISQLRHAMDAKRKFSSRLAHDTAFLTIASKLHSGGRDETIELLLRDIDQFQRLQLLIEADLNRMDDDVRQRITPPLRQPSQQGRARFIASLIDEADPKAAPAHSLG